MSHQVDISKRNPHKLVEVKALAAKYRAGDINNQLHQELVAKYQANAYYRMPVERADPFRFCFNATANTSRTLQVINGRGEVKLTIALTNSAAIGNLSSTGDAMTAYLYKLANLAALTQDGWYYLLLTVNFDGTTIKRFVSEPFEVKAKHPGTLLFEYWDTRNRDDVFSVQLPVRFCKRIVGIVKPTVPGVNQTTFEDSAPRPRLRILDSRPFRNWVMRLGGNGDGVAYWEIDKLNHIFGCNNVFINGTQFRRDDDAQWDETGDDLVPVAGYSLALREADESAASSFIDPVVTLFTIPSYPFAVSALTIKTSTGSVTPLVGDATVLDNSSQLPAFVAAMQAYATFQELTGTVSIAGGRVIYTNGVGENYTQASPSIYTTFFGFDFVVNFTSPPGLFPFLDMTFRRAGAIVDWGYGPVERVPATVSNTTVQRIYPATLTTYAVRIFGPTEYFGITSSARQGLTGTLPAGMKALSIVNGSFPSNTFNFAILNPVRTSLNSLAITNAGLTAANGFNNVYLPALQFIDFSGNAFTSTIVGAFMYDVHRNASNNNSPTGPIISNGVFSIGGQTTGAIPNAQANIYANLLRNAPFNWTINS